jgi:hypothetical protein
MSMTKKKLKVADKNCFMTSDDESDDQKNMSMLVSVGFTPLQVEAMIAVVSNTAPPSLMVSCGFWPAIAEKFSDYDKLTSDDLTRAGFSQAQVQAIAI